MRHLWQGNGSKFKPRGLADPHKKNLDPDRDFRDDRHFAAFTVRCHSEAESDAREGESKDARAHFGARLNTEVVNGIQLSRRVKPHVEMEVADESEAARAENYLPIQRQIE